MTLQISSKPGTAATVPCTKRIMGVDPSTYTGICTLTPDGVWVQVINFPKETGLHRLHLIAKQWAAVLATQKPDVVMIEGLSFGSKGKSVSILTEIQTMLRMQLYWRGVEWYTVPPSTLKLWVTGKGNADKAQIAVSVKEKWAFTHKSDDVIDAFALAQLGKQITAGMQPAALKGVTRGDCRLS